MKSIVVHYQEIALKGKNRPWFIGRLARNLRRAVADLDVTSVRTLMGRIELVLGRTALDLDIIAAAILEDLGDRECSSFRVSVRRADKRFPLTSPQAEREIGGRIKAVRGWRVDLDHADLVIHVELLTDDAFYFFGKERGAGGL